MSYYLLTYNQDFGDEFNVTSLECFNEEEFENWKNTKISDPVQNYEQDYKAWREKYDKYEEYQNKVLGLGLWSTPYKDWPAEHAYLRDHQPEYIGSYDVPKKFESKITAYLGNYGEGFSDAFSEYEYAKDLIEGREVDVQEVSEQFYNDFKRTKLADLSITNIFSLDF